MNRRGFLQACLAAATAPYVITSAGVLMPVKKILAVPADDLIRLTLMAAPGLGFGEALVKAEGELIKYDHLEKLQWVLSSQVDKLTKLGWKVVTRTDGKSQVPLDEPFISERAGRPVFGRLTVEADSEVSAGPQGKIHIQSKR